MSASYDAVIVGGGLNGLTAAALLAEAGKRVAVFEAGEALGGLARSFESDGGFLFPLAAHALHALDPVVTRKLKAVRRNLAFAARDLPTVALSGDGKHLQLSRDVHATARSIAAHSLADAERWPRFRKELYGLARALRAKWWDEGNRVRLDRAQRALLDTLETRSAAAWLDGLFESDLLKAALAFDVLESQACVLEPGSALVLLWRAAQEMCGLQGAVAVPRRGAASLVRLLSEAAAEAGAELRTHARVQRIAVDGGVVAGVELESGEVVESRLVLSTVSRRATLLSLAANAAPFGESAALSWGRAETGSATVSFGLSELPELGGAAVPPNARFLIADRLESFVAAHARARGGFLPDDLPIEAILTSVADDSVAPPAHHALTCVVRPVPLAPQDGWPVMSQRLTARTVAALDRFAPGLVPRVIETHAFTPAHYLTEDEPATPARILAGWRERMSTAIPGLILCGADAEPVAAASGRAGRIAATQVLNGLNLP
jgi:phytoene dehydrogenase-like protein